MVDAPQERRRLNRATGTALAGATLVTMVAILPAEYGIDPTGLGSALGLTGLHDAGPDADVLDTDGNRTLFSYQYSWTLSEEMVLNATGYLRADRFEHRLAVPVGQTNVTHVRATLEWIDESASADGGQPDRFALAIVSPGGTRRSQLVANDNDPAGHGRIQAELAWRTVPFPGAATPTAVAASDDSAQGEWTIQIRLLKAGAHGNGSADAGNAWRVQAYVQRFEAAVSRVELVNATDTVRLRLVPGGMVEYKFHMEPNATMNYSWHASSPIPYDLHSDRPEWTEDQAVSHARGRAAQGSGLLLAGFSGRHGWWWFNDTPDPVTITLQTVGEYRILGVV